MNKVIIASLFTILIFLVGCGTFQKQASESVTIEVISEEPPSVQTSGVPYIRYEKSKYEQSLAEGKVVLLDFYANWCPICRIENPKIISALKELDSTKIAAFQVHYNDNEVNEEDREVAKEFGITYQHTKVIVKDDTQFSKSLEVWNKEKTIQEINKAL